MEDLQRLRKDCHCHLFFLPSLPHLGGGGGGVKTKEGKKAAKNTMETDTAETVIGSDLIASLLT